MPSLTTAPPKATPEAAQSAAAHLWLTGADAFFALAAQPDRDRTVTDHLITVATWPGVVTGWDRWNDVIAALLTDPQLTAGDALRLGWALNPVQPRLLPAYAALLDHPSCTAAAAGHLLVSFAHVPAFGEYRELAEVACEHGSLLPAAVALTWRRRPIMIGHDDHEVAAVEMAERLAALCEPDPALCRVLTALAEGWTAEPADLVTAALGVSR